MGVTTTYGWHAPNLADPANGPSNILTALQDAENTVKDTTLLTYTSGWISDGDTQPSGAVSKVGTYRVDHGICHLNLRIASGPSTSGGTGGLSLTVPIAPSLALPRQILPAEIYIPYAGAGTYMGFGLLTNVNGSQLIMYFPASASDTRLSVWRNATNGNGAGTGIPLVPSWFGMIDGSEVVVSGSYYL